MPDIDERVCAQSALLSTRLARIGVPSGDSFRLRLQGRIAANANSAKSWDGLIDVDEKCPSNFLIFEHVHKYILKIPHIKNRQ